MDDQLGLFGDTPVVRTTSFTNKEKKKLEREGVKVPSLWIHETDESVEVILNTVCKVCKAGQGQRCTPDQSYIVPPREKNGIKLGGAGVWYAFHMKRRPKKGSQP